MRYFPLSEPIDSVVKPLVLFGWQTDYWRREPVDEKEEKATGWMGFNVPSVLTVTDSLDRPPKRAPLLEKLDIKPKFVTDNEEVIWGPAVYISLDKQETEDFITFVRRTHENLQKLDVEKSGWHFFEVALNMLVKAFFAEGLEQLLWHITAIEALLGEDTAGLNEKLARRVATICRKTEKEKDSLRKKFKKLYTFRSDLVHGNRFKKEVYAGHLREARDFARRTLVWFLEFLAIVQDVISQDQNNINYPKRNLLLKLLDMDATERSQLEALLRILPSGFPQLR